MARAARARRGGAENLDSLLDTMANVTGILVVLLAVTQISVADAMERLRGQMAERPELTHESLAMARAEAEMLREALAPLAPRRQDFEGMRRGRRDELAALRAANSEARAAYEATRLGDAEDIERRIAAGQHRENALRAELEGTRAELARLEAELAAGNTGSNPRVARLPDPRPAPQGATEVVFMCRYQRCFEAEAKRLVDVLVEGGRRATGGRWQPFGGGRGSAIVDRGQIVTYFRNNDIGTERLRWHIIDLGPTKFYAQLEWREQTAGETADQLERAGSHYQRQLRSLSRSRHFLRFMVWDDSFDAYLAARDYANSAGFAAGWAPFNEHEPFRQDLTRNDYRATID